MPTEPLSEKEVGRGGMLQGEGEGPPELARLRKDALRELARRRGAVGEAPPPGEGSPERALAERGEPLRPSELASTEPAVVASSLATYFGRLARGERPAQARKLINSEKF